MRHCGDCTLCCKLLPMKANATAEHLLAVAKTIELGLAVPGIAEFDKPAGERCPDQRHHKGCAIYARRPNGCQLWNCRWLLNDDTADLRRPDRAGYVIDVMLDFITLDPGDGSPQQNIQAVVIWVDGDERWRDDVALRDYLIRRGLEGKVAMIRFNSRDATTVFPPNMCSDGQWREFPRNQTTQVAQHTAKELFEGLAAASPVHLAIPK
jgi:hypothetical protein